MTPIAFGIEISEGELSCSPSSIDATARVIFRVTKVSPRVGPSWLNSMPFDANIPYASR